MVMSPRKHVEVTIVGARGLKKVAWIGVNQPVAVAWVSPRAARSTHVAVNGGSNPMWNQRLLVPINEDLQPSVSWVLKVQVSHHVGFLCCVHRPIGTAIIPVADILNAGNGGRAGSGSGSSSHGHHGIGTDGVISGTSSSPHINDPGQPLPILTYPLLGAFNRQHGFLDVTLRLLKVLPQSQPPSFLPPSPSAPIPISPPPHSSPASSSQPPSPTPSSPFSSSSKHLHEDHETPNSSPTHISSSSSSSKHSFHEADRPLSPPPSPPPLSNSSPLTPKVFPPSKSSPPPSPHSTLRNPSTNMISPLPLSPFIIPPSSSPTVKLAPAGPPPIKPIPPPPPIKKASLPITAPIPTSLTSGPFPTKPNIPAPPMTQKASLPIPIPPPHTTAIIKPPSTIAFPIPKKPSTPCINIDAPLPTPPISNPTLLPHQTIDTPTPLRPSSTLPYPAPPTRYPPPLIIPPPTSKRTLPTIPTTPQITSIHISTTSVLPIPCPPSPMANSTPLKKDVSPSDNIFPSPIANLSGDNGKHSIDGSCEHVEGFTSSSTTKSKNGVHEEVSPDDGDPSVVGPISKFKNEENGSRCDESESHNDPFIPSPYDDPFFDLEHLYPQPHYSEPLYMDSTHLYPCEEEMEASYHYPFESYRILTK